MQMNHRLGAVLATLFLFPMSALAQLAPTAFTYQGQLKQNGQAADTTVPMQFRLFDAAIGGSQVGSTVTLPGVDVVEGLFTARLDFGAIASGTGSLWLEITVGGFVMSPREEVSASPYSLQTRGIHVDASGRVGIGTVSPSGDLEIAKDGASLVIRSTQAFTPATAVLQGSVPGIGGIYSRLIFENGFGAEIFGIRHDNAFGLDFLTLTTAAFSNGLIRVKEDGEIAIGDVPSTAPLHVTDRDIGVYNDGMLNETLALEDNDAVLGIYSSNTGNFGSGLVFGESINNEVTNKWGMVRTTSNTAPELRVTYGSNANYAQNPSSVTFVPGGLKFPDGSVQNFAAAGLSVTDSESGSNNTNYSTPIPPAPGYLFVDTERVTVESTSSKVLVVGAATAFSGNNASIVFFQLAYRPAGSGGAPIPLTAMDRGSTSYLNLPSCALATGLPPGDYDFGFVFQMDPGGTSSFYGGNDIVILVFE
jgi:hypothetical protein